MKIAILEDNLHHAALLADWLVEAGHAAVRYQSGKSFIKEASREACDFVIVGTSLSSMNSMEVLMWLREHLGKSLPILRLVDGNNEAEIVAALKAGADDCIVMPPRHAEFFARIEAIERRVPRAARRAQMVNYGDLSVDLKNRVILRAGQRISLTPKSYDLAVFLFSNMGQLLSRAYLMDRIWGRSSGASTRTLDTHISRLRATLGLTPENGWLLQSVYQHGYRLEQLDANRESRAA